MFSDSQDMDVTNYNFIIDGQDTDENLILEVIDLDTDNN
jgi:hypothetical protein